MTRRLQRLIAVRRAARVQAGAAAAEALAAVAGQRMIAGRIEAAIAALDLQQGPCEGQGLLARLEWAARLGDAADAARQRMTVVEAALQPAQARRAAAAKAVERAETRHRELSAAETQRREALGRSI